MNEIFSAKSLSKNCETEYLNRFFPNNNVLDCSDFIKKNDLKTYNYNELEKYEIWGTPYSIRRNSQGELSATFQDASHAVVIGTTQVGKTWGHVIGSVYTLSAKKNKPCFMITDPKGEISEATAEILKKRGYKVFALNFKDSQHSNMWNPLLEIYDSWMELKDIDTRLEFHTSLEGLTKYSLENPISSYEKCGFYWSFYGKAYSDSKQAHSELAQKKADIENRTFDLVNQLVSSIGGTFLKQTKEPIWEHGAIQILKGVIYLLLEDALDKNSGFTRDNMNFMNMQRYFEIVRDGVFTGVVNTPLTKVTKLWHKKNTDHSIRYMKPFMQNAANTARSYAGVFENIVQDWFNPKIYSLTNGNNIEIGNYQDEPFAVFLITRDYEKSDYYIAGLFIDWLYKEMLTRADKNGGKLEREMIFLLDEFANIPVLSSFTNKISTSLSRRIIFQLYVQSYEQIEGNYGDVDARTIIANCNTEIFLGSQSYKTKREFSDACGTKRIKTPDAALTPDKNNMMEIPVISINELESLSRGEAYMRRLNKPTSKTHFEMAYMCPEFSHHKLSAGELGIVSPPYNDERFIYKYLENENPMSMYEKEYLESRVPYFYDAD